MLAIIQRFLLLLLTCSSAVGFAQSDHLPPTILVMGDSLSAAYGIERDRGWVTLLQHRLRQQDYPHRVVNASISGETTSGGLARIDRELATHQPDIVLIALGANDGLRGLPLKAMRKNLGAMIEKSKNKNIEVVLIGMHLPPNYGPAYTNAFHDSYATVAQHYSVNHIPFLLSGIGQQKSLFQRDGLHPTAAAQPIILDNVWPQLLTLLAHHKKTQA